MDYINAVKKLKLPDENNTVLLAIQTLSDCRADDYISPSALA